jgi:thymidylate synthase
MRLIPFAGNNPETILNMYRMVWRGGHESEARGQKTKNIRNLAVVMDAATAPLTSFKARNLNLAYCKREWLWYLGADKMDASIMEHAKMWTKLQQPDGSFYSNYGQYMFAGEGEKPSQFVYCLNQLKEDAGTRRASMVLLQPYHLFPENTDTVCTYSINFCIEEDTLHMTVMMRSNDVIFGFTNDAFCFQQLYTFMLALLRRKYNKLRAGTYTHIANSMHVYERHYEMIDAIIRGGMRFYEPIQVPAMYDTEAAELIKSKGQYNEGVYPRWLHA